MNCTRVLYNVLAGLVCVEFFFFKLGFASALLCLCEAKPRITNYLRRGWSVSWFGFEDPACNVLLLSFPSVLIH